jgi:hypothetical protein
MNISQLERKATLNGKFNEDYEPVRCIMSSHQSDINRGGGGVGDEPVIPHVGTADGVTQQSLAMQTYYSNNGQHVQLHRKKKKQQPP